mgnify:CR=1 FL=1
MDINEKKVEIIQHILIIQKPSVLRKIDQFIRDLEYDEEDGYHHQRMKPLEDGNKKGPSRANVIGSKIKGFLNMDDK